MKKSGFLDETLGSDHILEQEGAIEHLFDKVLDPSVCIYECEHRVFAECQALEKHAYDAKLPPAPRAAPHSRPARLRRSGSRNWPATRTRWSSTCASPRSTGTGHVPGRDAASAANAAGRGAPRLPKDRTAAAGLPVGPAHLPGDPHARGHGLHQAVRAERRHPGLARGGVAGGRRDRRRSDSVALAEGLSVSEAGESRQRQVLAAMRLNRRTEELETELEVLATTGDLSRLRGSLERLLDRLAASPAGQRRPASTSTRPGRC